jgi:CDP-diacylglycerol--glycerol-3-phosphate 3-phosphatidyltransferase
MSSRTSSVVLAGVLGVAFVSMLVFALMGRRQDRDAAAKGSQFLMGAGNFLVHWFLWVLGPVDRLAHGLGLSPDFFNFAGLGLGLLAGLAIGTGRLEWGGVAIALGGIADIMDGRVARARNLASDYGKFIDATLDRFVEVFALLGFVVFLRRFPVGPLLAAAALAGSLLVSYTRARGESVGVLCKEGLMQRAERLVLLSLVCLADGAITERLAAERGSAALVVLGLIAIGTLATAVHRTFWIAARLRARGGSSIG